ncbi:MAG: MFS transporter [Chloroflexi bacterium]|nr:MFS transporter [Chloroflexota bacterium]
MLHAFSSLTVPQFRTLWLGMLFSLASMQMDLVARSWLAYDLSGSGLALGLVVAARGLPQLLCSVVAGVAADRLDKRRLLIATQLSLALLALANGVLVHLGVVAIWHLVIIGALQGAVFAFNFPARQAYIPELVGIERLANALAVHATGMNASRVVAPAAAGLLLTWSPTVAFYAIAAGYAATTLTLLRLPPGRKPSGQGTGATAEIVGGFRYIVRQPVLRSLMGLAFVPVLLGVPYQHLLPVFQADVLRVGPSQLGLMYTAAGVGSLVGSLGVAYLAASPRQGQLQLVAGIAFGVALAGFALSRAYEVSLALLFVVGLTSQAYLTINGTLLMVYTDRKFYGRVMSIYNMTWAFQPLATLPLGGLVDVLGAPATMAGAGALLAVLVAAIGVANPVHRRMVTVPSSAGGRPAPPRAS